MKEVITFDSQLNPPEEVSEIDEVEGSLKRDDSDDKLMHTMVQADEEKDYGSMIVESINQGVGSFTPDTMFRNLVNNFRNAENLYGETMIRQLTGYDPSFVKKNINIPEFRNEVRGNVEKNVQALKDRGLIDKQGVVTREGFRLSSIIMYMEELEKLKLKGWGDKKDRKKHHYGEKESTRDFRGDRYRDIEMKQSVKQAIRRGHDKLLVEDLKAYEREKKGRLNVIYCLDASGSMKGSKLGTAKKAGIALAYKAIQEKNKVGMIVFGSDIKKSIPPTNNFRLLLEELAAVQAGMETDIAKTINKAIELFGRQRVTKHVLLITDALPTKGRRPVNDAVKAAALARENGITISVLGINLDRDGLKLAKKIVEVGQGRLYKVKDLEEMDGLVLEDYYSFA